MRYASFDFDFEINILRPSHKQLSACQTPTVTNQLGVATSIFSPRICTIYTSRPADLRGDPRTPWPATPLHVKTRRSCEIPPIAVGHVNPLTGTLKPHSNGPLYNDMVIGTLAVDEWAVTFGTARRDLSGLGPAQSPPRCTKCNSPPINGQCTNFILFEVAL